jgi:rhamnogalacturonyl hydrolase YesR
VGTRQLLDHHLHPRIHLPPLRLLPRPHPSHLPRVDTISHPSDSLRLYLLGTLKAQIDALLKYQDPESGLWHTLLDDESTYLGASGSAGFAFGMLEAGRKGHVGGRRSKEE